MSSKCPALMTEIKDLVPWLQENKIRLDVVYLHSKRSKLGGRSIAPTGSRHVVLAAAHATRALAPGRVDIGFAGLHRSLRVQAECSGYKIRHSAPLSSQCCLQRLAPRLVADCYALDKPAMTSPAPSLGKTSSVKGQRYPCLPLLAPSAMVSRRAAVLIRPLPSAASASLRQITPSRHGRTFRQSRGATAVSGLRLCVKNGLLQACVLLTTQGDNSRIRWSASQECQHVLSADIRPYFKKLLGTSPALLQELALPTNFMLRNVSTLAPSFEAGVRLLQGGRRPSTVKSYDQK
jgi:hypothetical protein